ncbi:MAG: excinuclease ABC subunit UvrB [Alphaproteobacteria bacterium]|nr:excinuclease ABC subunit UvrB [Alphaproteobacteria bacterium]
MTQKFKLSSPFTPQGDQPKAIKSIVDYLDNGEKNVLLEGVTGSGKTFTMANVIQQRNTPTLVLAPNKILAAQLYQEMMLFFPDNAVEYFVSYYDYYQPEAFLARKNLYIAKESSINSHIDRLRHNATRSLLERNDTIIIASVSCIYGIGSKDEYHALKLRLSIGEKITQKECTTRLIAMSYRRNAFTFDRGTFRLRGRHIEIFPAHLEEEAWRITLAGNAVQGIATFDPISGETRTALSHFLLYPNTHYASTRKTLENAAKCMEKDMVKETSDFMRNSQFEVANRLRERTLLDIEMLKNTGSCEGVENYSRYFTQRNIGEPPPTLLEYFPQNALLIVDESHMAIPQLKGMFLGDRARKRSLVDYGFRLKACLDNRPLTFDEWDALRPQTLFVSATPGDWESARCPESIKQIIRPTGLLDPPYIVRATKHSVADLMHECLLRKKKGERVLVTTLTKKSAEMLTEFLITNDIPSRYMHSDVDTLERTVIIQDLRQGVFDVLVGINLLREGLDIPECSLVVILDADKAGYLRSKTALIQTMGRAARHVNGLAILYADKIPYPLKMALQEVKSRRALQMKHNTEHNITPMSIQKEVHSSLLDKEKDPFEEMRSLSFAQLVNLIKSLEKDMHTYAKKEDFENAHTIQTQIKRAQSLLLKR